LKILRGEHATVQELAQLTSREAPLLGGFAAFRAERLCLSVGHLFIEGYASD
jgi:hypothetical protein